MAFATTDELADGWRPLSDAEKNWAGKLLGSAERWIRKRRPDIAADDPDANVVVLSVVRSALGPGAHLGFSSFSRNLGPRGKSGTLTNPNAALVWEDWMKELLDIATEETALGHFENGDRRERW